MKKVPEVCRSTEGNSDILSTRVKLDGARAQPGKTTPFKERVRAEMEIIIRFSNGETMVKNVQCATENAFNIGQNAQLANLIQASPGEKQEAKHIARSHPSEK